MQPSIQIRCSGCNARIKAPAELIGQTRGCPGCGQRLLIQRKPPEDSEPLVLDADWMALTSAPGNGNEEEKVILLVDDDRELNDGLRFLLEKQGHRVIQAFDGAEAREMVHRKRPDLIILDMMMPKMGGYPLLEYFHKRPEAPPIIMITAKEGSQHKLYAEYLGVADYLNKPFAIERFLESVEKCLGGTQGELSGAQGE
jgi:CheY-like chemotaxis protein/DNA-directed RNA polymerase subunit RPC12/RpoP